ncbi:hypothetical protein [Lysobacter gummosus]|uniref:hypothetical protein n=1 Tax=Lysobacter gummosus TaxID=262324 RepID=UPI00363CF9A4
MRRGAALGSAWARRRRRNSRSGCRDYSLAVSNRRQPSPSSAAGRCAARKSRKARTLAGRCRPVA